MEKNKTINKSDGNVKLEVKPQGWETVLFPEQAAAFEIALTNGGHATETVLSLEANLDTPVFHVFNANNEKMIEFSYRDMRIRRRGEAAQNEFSETVTFELPAGERRGTFVNLWAFTAPLAPGRYAMEASHQLNTLGGSVISNRISFEIVAADVGEASLSYESPGRSISDLAWTAKHKDGKTDPILLVRLSGSAGHGLVQEGGTSHGEVPPNAQIACSQVPMGGRAAWLAWVGYTSEKGVEVIKHNMSYPHWRSGIIPLSMSSLSPVPRFPDRGQSAVFMATGKGPDDPALIGVVAQEGIEKPAPWSVALSTIPTHSACAFEAEGPISLLFVSDSGAETKFSRLDVKDDGEVTSPERVIRTTVNEVLSLAVDMRPSNAPEFLVLEADREKYDHLALIRVPLTGAPQLTTLNQVAGWPCSGEGEKRKPVKALEVCLEMGMDGTAWLALTTERGGFYGGALNGSPLSLLRDEGNGAKAVYPHIAALYKGVTFSCFTETGALFHATVRGRM